MSATQLKSDNRMITRDTAAQSGLTRWLALGAVIGPVLFTLAWVVLGFISPGYTLFGIHIAPYSPISQPISGLGMGVTAPWMNTAFVLGGLTLAIGIVGLFQRIPELGARERWLVTGLLLLTPLGMIVDGVFNLESFMPHFIGFILAVGTPIISFVIVGRILRRIPEWRALGTGLLIASPLTLILMVVYFASFDQNAAMVNLGVAGLTQRLLVTELLFWFVLMGLWSWRQA